MREFWRKMRRRKNIDFRNDPAPTDWLSKTARTYDHIEVDFKTDYDYLNEFIDKLSGMRCQPVCSDGQSAVSRPPVSCICSLVEQLFDEKGKLVPVGEVVPMGEFMAVVLEAGIDREQALVEYKRYATERIGSRYNSEFKRLYKETKKVPRRRRGFALDKLNDDKDGPMGRSREISKKTRALIDKIDKEVEAAMSAWSPGV